MLKNKYYKSPIGVINILYSEEGIFRITLVENVPIDYYFEERKNDLGDKVISELKEYFNGQRKDFDLPLIIQGTDFQRAVWEELRKINYGEIKTCLLYTSPSPRD